MPEIIHPGLRHGAGWFSEHLAKVADSMGKEASQADERFDATRSAMLRSVHITGARVARSSGGFDRDGYDC